LQEMKALRARYISGVQRLATQSLRGQAEGAVDKLLLTGVVH
jgi:hypothetical protein